MGFLNFEWSAVLDFTGRLFLAAIVGVAVSFRRRPDRYQLSLMEAHAFLSTAAAIFMIIIAGEIIRAVGLLGAASVIRYRYAIRNPRDAGTLIVALGLGMACGSGLLEIAVVGAIFVIIISRLLRILPEAMPLSALKQTEEIILRIQTTDFDATMEKVKMHFENFGVHHAITSFERKFSERKGDTTEVELHIKYQAGLILQDLADALMDDKIIRISWHDLPYTEF